MKNTTYTKALMISVASGIMFSAMSFFASPVLAEDSTVPDNLISFPIAVHHGSPVGFTTLSLEPGLSIFNNAISRPPEGAVYHQTVDRYFDKDGNPIKITSMTHAVDLDCHQGRRQQDLIASIKDDGKGNVKFFPTEVYAA